MYDKFKKLSKFDLLYLNFNPNIFVDEKQPFKTIIISDYPGITQFCFTLFPGK
jgi:hypothetical protein